MESDMIFNERYTEDDILLLIQAFTALISTSCNRRKRNSHVTCLRWRGFLFTYKRSRDVNKCAPRIEGVTKHRFSPILEAPFAASGGSSTDVPVGSLFVVNTLEALKLSSQ